MQATKQHQRHRAHQDRESQQHRQQQRQGELGRGLQQRRQRVPPQGLQARGQVQLHRHHRKERQGLEREVSEFDFERLFSELEINSLRYNVGGRYYRNLNSNYNGHNYSKSVSDVNRKWFGLEDENGGKELKVSSLFIIGDYNPKRNGWPSNLSF